MSNKPTIYGLIEGDYCCLRGYLELCRYRGEMPDSMAAHQGIAGSTIRYHYAQISPVFTPKSHRCAEKADCMKCLWEGGATSSSSE